MQNMSEYAATMSQPCGLIIKTS